MEPNVNDGFQGEPSGAAPAGTAEPQTQQPPQDGQDPTTGGSQTPQVPKGYVPEYRIREQAQRIRQLEAQIREAGVGRSQPQPRQAEPAPYNAQAEQVKQEFFGLFPQAKMLFELLDQQPDLLKRMQETVELAPQFQQEVAQRWTQHGANALRLMHAEGAKIVGAPLTAQAQKWHEAAFIAYLETDPEKQDRYMRGDLESLVRDYWQEVNTNMYDPIRRKSVVTAQTRADRVSRVPSAGPGNQVMGKGAAKPKTEDDIHEAAWDRMQQERP